jgi:hypothetical protein
MSYLRSFLSGPVVLVLALLLFHVGAVLLSAWRGTLHPMQISTLLLACVASAFYFALRAWRLRIGQR